MPERKQGVADPRAAVRKGQFAEQMSRFNAEQGMKVSVVLSKYDEEFVQPRLAAMEARIATLEAQWWTRLWRKVR